MNVPHLLPNQSLESVRLTGKYCRVCLRYRSITDGPSLENIIKKK
jgi:hypothetical protein